MTTLGPITTDKIVAALPAAVKHVLIGHRCWLGGGFIRAIVADEKPSDVDLFVSSQASADAIANDFVLGFGCTAYRSGNSITLRGLEKPVQIITRWTYDTPEAVIASFDYTLAQAVVWNDQYNGWFSCVADTFESDVINRKLVYTSPVRVEEQAGSLFRLFKFYKRGYSVSLETLAAVMGRAVGYPQDVYPVDILTALQAAGRYLPKPPSPADYSDEPELVAGIGPGIGGSSSC